MSALLALAATPLFKAADTPPSPSRNRVSTVDGLRGFLALGVFFYHAVVYHEYLIDGKWVLEPSRLYPLLGQTGVAVFFMITGYLFWSQMLNAAGQPSWLRLYVGRLFRIGPLYLLAVTAMLAIVFSRTGLQLHVPPLQLARQIGVWLLLGAAKGQPDVNGYSAWLVLSGVTWTLRLEWLFYLSLLVTSRAARSPRTHLPFAAAGWAMCLAFVAWHTKPLPIAPLSVSCLLFFSGMLCASLQKKGLTVRLPKTVASALVALIIGVVMSMFSNANQAISVVLIGFAFFLVLSGADLFGLLSSRAAIRLGDVSYGIYLLQGLVLTLVLPFDPVRAFALGSPVKYWATVLLCAVLLVTVACIAHVLVERPGIRAGKQASLLLEAWGLQLKGLLRPAPVSGAPGHRPHGS
jgi:peptidoglycan/LPS O-acetylase OafA/YrhL